MVAGPNIAYFNYSPGTGTLPGNTRYRYSGEELVVFKYNLDVTSFVSCELVQSTISAPADAEDIKRTGIYLRLTKTQIEVGRAGVFANYIQPLGLSAFFNTSSIPGVPYNDMLSGLSLRQTSIKNANGFLIEAGTPMDFPDGTTYVTVEEWIPIENFQAVSGGYAAPVQHQLYLQVDDLDSPTSARLGLPFLTSGEAQNIVPQFAQDRLPHVYNVSGYANPGPYVDFGYSSTVDATTGLNVGRVQSTWSTPFTNYSNPERLAVDSVRIGNYSYEEGGYIAPYKGYFTIPGNPTAVSQELKINFGYERDAAGEPAHATAMYYYQAPPYYYGIAIVQNPSTNFEYNVGDVLTVHWIEEGKGPLGQGTAVWATGTYTITERMWGFGMHTHLNNGLPSYDPNSVVWYDTQREGYPQLVSKDTYSEDFEYTFDWETGQFVGSGTIPNCVTSFDVDLNLMDPFGGVPVALTKGDWFYEFDKELGVIKKFNQTEVENGLRISRITKWDEEAEERDVTVSVMPLHTIEYGGISVSDFNDDHTLLDRSCIIDIPDFTDMLDVRELTFKNQWPIRLISGGQPGFPDTSSILFEKGEYKIKTEVSFIGPWQNNRDNAPPEPEPDPDP